MNCVGIFSIGPTTTKIIFYKIYNLMTNMPNILTPQTL